MANLKKYRGVLFDLDGTLVDNYTALHTTACLVFDEYGFPRPSYEEVVHAVGGSILVTLKNLLTPLGKAELADESAKRYLELFSAHALDGLKMLPYADKILAALKSRGVKLACFTNKHKEGAESVLNTLGFDANLDAIVATSLHSVRKPDPEFTRFALGKIGVDASETLGVGDSPYDYNAAELGGIDCALVSTGAHTRNFLAANCPHAVGVYSNLSDLARGVFGIALR